MKRRSMPPTLTPGPLPARGERGESPQTSSIRIICGFSATLPSASISSSALRMAASVVSCVMITMFASVPGAPRGRASASYPPWRWAQWRRCPSQQATTSSWSRVPRSGSSVRRTTSRSTRSVSRRAASPDAPRGRRGPRTVRSGALVVVLARAPSGIRTHTGSGLSRTPLPVGLSGPDDAGPGTVPSRETTITAPLRRALYAACGGRH